MLISEDENKFDSITVVMLGTASAVLGVYVSNVISKAIAPVPMLNVLNRQVTNMLSGVVVTAVPLSAVYVFDKETRPNSCLRRSAVTVKPESRGMTDVSVACLAEVATDCCKPTQEV